MINVVVGSQAQILWRVRQYAKMNQEYAIFHITSDDKQLLYGTFMTEGSNPAGVFLLDPGGTCIASEDNRLPVDYLLGFEDVNFQHSGVYSLEVVIFDGANQNFSFTSNVTLNGERILVYMFACILGDKCVMAGSLQCMSVCVCVRVCVCVCVRVCVCVCVCVL